MGRPGSRVQLAERQRYEGYRDVALGESGREEGGRGMGGTTVEGRLQRTRTSEETEEEEVM